MAHRIVTLPGDGIGPEIMAPTLALLNRLGEFEFDERVFGGASIDAHGTALTDETLAACSRADAVLLAAVGGPRWDTTDPSKPRPEQGLLGLRKGLGLYANLRPVKPLPALYESSPLRRERIEGTDLLVVRELTGGIYFGEKTRTETSASDVCTYTTAEIAMGGQPDTQPDTAPRESDLLHLRQFIFEKERPRERARAGDVTLFSAPGEGREAVEIVRRILDEASRGVPFDEMAVFLRTPQQYLGLLEHACARGDVPGYFDRGTRRPDPAGRAFVALLSCAVEGLSAKRFDEYLSLGQVPRVGD